MPGRRPRLLVTLALAIAVTAIAPDTQAGEASGDCAGPRARSRQAAALGDALLAGRDVLGEELLASPAGPTYQAVRRRLPSLWYARGRGGVALTRSGAYYLVFASPLSLYGEKAFALHVADGSQILTRRSDGPSLTVLVGGRERYGSCLSRLGQPRLAGGSLPILRTTYVDARGVRYDQESFAGRIPGVRSLVSFVRLKVDARRSTSGTAIVRFVPSSGSRERLVGDGRGGGEENGLRYRVRGTAVIHVAWAHRPVPGVTVDASSYHAARRSMVDFWESELAHGTVFDVPERRVMDGQRNLLIQQRILTWRYSVGHAYEELSFAEALDAAQVMAGYGHADVSEAILRFALRRLPSRYTNWRAGAVLAAAAYHARVTGDGSFVVEQRPALEAALERLERQIHRPGGDGLLDREAFSSDVRRTVVALHGQAVARTGLLAMGRVWAQLKRPDLAARATAAGRRLDRALQAAVRASERRLSDGSLFVPAALLDGGAPFDRLTASREGSYWNLVMPYALASGLFDPDAREAQGIWRYMQGHGSRLLGLVRADADRLYRGAPYPASGVDQVYGLNMARFLADADLPDQLVLSLYGTLAGAMTPATFVSGEAATIAPLSGLRLGAMYLSPNGGTNTAFLETLRVALVHERRGPRGAPVGVELAFATPRAWLQDRKTIRVVAAPTSFGPVSYTIARRGARIEIDVNAPSTPSLRLRLRLPAGDAIASVTTKGRAVPFEAASGTIDLSRQARKLELVARVRG